MDSGGEKKRAKKCPVGLSRLILTLISSKSPSESTDCTQQLKYQSSAARGRLKSTKSWQEAGGITKPSSLNGGVVLWWTAVFAWRLSIIELTRDQLSALPFQQLINTCRAVASGGVQEGCTCRTLSGENSPGKHGDASRWMRPVKVGSMHSWGGGPGWSPPNNGLTRLTQEQQCTDYSSRLQD